MMQGLVKVACAACIVTTLSVIVTVVHLIADLRSLQSDINNQMGEFTASADGAWVRLRRLQEATAANATGSRDEERSNFAALFMRTKRDASGQCGCRERQKFCPPGLPGLPGIHGKDGIAGKDGIPGERGQPARYEKNSYFSENGCIRCPAGPQGLSGAPGQQGVAGRDGLPGEAGPIGKDGKRGAVGRHGYPGRQGMPGSNGEAGFTGEDGIIYLRGERGATGPVGPDGRMGHPGPDGLPGVDGVPGKKGVPGFDGPPGMAGLDGTPGIPGYHGRPGYHGGYCHKFHCPGNLSLVYDEDDEKSLPESVRLHYRKRIHQAASGAAEVAGSGNMKQYHRSSNAFPVPRAFPVPIPRPVVISNYGPPHRQAETHEDSQESAEVSGASHRWGYLLKQEQRPAPASLVRHLVSDTKEVHRRPYGNDALPPQRHPVNSNEESEEETKKIAA